MAFKSMHGQMIIPFTLEFFIFMRRTLKYQYIKKTVRIVQNIVASRSSFSCTNVLFLKQLLVSCINSG